MREALAAVVEEDGRVFSDRDLDRAPLIKDGVDKFKPGKFVGIDSSEGESSGD